MALNARNKGAAGERELARWLMEHLSLSELPQRNLEQVRSGGADLTPVGNLLFEVKRCEVLQLNSWWIQVKSAARYDQEPVVAFRQNRKQWMFLISAKHIGVENGYLLLNGYTFLKWANDQLNKLDNAGS